MPSDKMGISGIQNLPVLLFLLFPFTFLGTYLAGVLQGHVEPNFPYISDAASYPPESCVFSQLINLGSVLMVLLIYVRYCAICQYYELYSISPNIMVLNKLGLFLGICSALGLSIVANFQSLAVKTVHFAGACLCFGAGTLYFWIQALCSYQMHSLVHSIILAHFRVGLSMVCTVFFVISLVTGVQSRIEFDGDDVTKWYPDDKGWMLHVVSTGSEWITATCFCIYILTFYSEFSLISFTHPKINLRHHITSECEEDLLHS
ncbi:DNA damage-regulated autophagy modulator protein 2 [Cimex lectularius]|uniref:CWH43-like N-terminal domain-containing protein n=1 Tax=Cimex lectularius TaxID=79782 RepID=A0A8I6S269_CIMLE|nr:DNA damage-regulated autophagy modulator protein 2 [Cimex lectularius]